MVLLLRLLLGGFSWSEEISSSGILPCVLVVPLDDKGIFISGRVVMGGRAADGKLNEGEDEEGSLKSIGSMIEVDPHKKLCHNYCICMEYILYVSLCRACFKIVTLI